MSFDLKEEEVSGRPRIHVNSQRRERRTKNENEPL